MQGIPSVKSHSNDSQMSISGNPAQPGVIPEKTGCLNEKNIQVAASAVIKYNPHTITYTVKHS